MFTKSSCKWFVVAVLVLTLVPACSGELEQDWPNSLRQASVYVNPSSNTGAAPFEALISVNVHGHAGDTGTGKYGEKIEIDYGDGSGWADVTTEVLAILFARDNGTAIPASEWFSHTYTEPGDYILCVRVTWQDNDVTYSPGTSVPMITVTTASAEPSGGDDPEQDEWVIVPFTDPRDGTTYDIIDGRVIVAFRLPLDRPAADAFIAAEDLEVYAEWWEVAGVGVLLPAGVSVLDAVTDWPGQYPALIDSVDPDAATGAET